MIYILLVFLASIGLCQNGSDNPYDPPPAMVLPNSDSLVGSLEILQKEHSIQQASSSLQKYRDAQIVLSNYVSESFTWKEEPSDCQYSDGSICTGSRVEVVEDVMDTPALLSRIKALSPELKVAFLALVDFSTLDAHQNIANIFRKNERDQEWIRCLFLARVQRSLAILSHPSMVRSPIPYVGAAGNVVLFGTALAGSLYHQEVMLAFKDQPIVGWSILVGGLLSAWGIKYLSSFLQYRISYDKNSQNRAFARSHLKNVLEQLHKFDDTFSRVLIQIGSIASQYKSQGSYLISPVSCAELFVAMDML